MSTLLKNLRVTFQALCLIGLLSFVCAAQSSKPGDISGLVKDPLGAAIPQATVSLLDARQFVVATTQTDAQGRFTLSGVAQGSYELFISYRGFAPRRLAVSLPPSEAQKIDVSLGIAAFEVEITVTADLGLVQSLDETSQRVNVIGELQLDERAKSVLAQAAQEEVGVNLQRTSPTIGAIFVRGLTGAKVVTFVDGIRFSTSAMRGGINSFFNLNDASNLRAVEILRGPNSAQYGSDSLGGAVQLISQMPSYATDRPEVHGRIGTFFNSGDLTFGGNTLATYSRRKLALLVNLTSSRHNTIRPGGGFDTHAAVTRFLGINSNVFGERMTDTAFTQYGGLVRLNYQPAPTHQLTLHYQRDQQDGGKRYDQTLGGDGNLIADLRNFMLDFFYVRYEKLRAGWFDSLAVSYSLNTQREERVNQGGNGNPNGTITFQNEHTYVNGTQVTANRQWGTRNSLAAGGEFYYDLVHAPAHSLNPVTRVDTVSRPRVPDKSNYRSGGFYMQDVWNAIPARLRLTGALRYGFASYHSLAANSPLVGGKPLWPDDQLSVGSVTPRFGAMLTLLPGLSLSTQISRGFRAPSITDLGTLGLTGNGYEVPYADVADRNASIGSTADATAVTTGRPIQQLVPESSWNYEGSLHLRRSQFDFDITGFVNDISDNIAVQTLILPQGAVGTKLGDQVITSQLASGAVFVAAASNPVLIRSNFDEARIYGIEQKLDLRITSTLSFSNTFTYLHAEDKRTGLPPNIEGGTPAPQGWIKLRYEPASRHFWIEPYVYAAGRQDRLSTLDLGDRRTGATRSRSNIRSFFLNGATVRGLIGPGTDGKLGTTDDILLQTGETLAQVQDRVLGVGVSSAPLFSAIPGFLTVGLRGGIRLGERQDLMIDFENINDRNYRGISWGLDAPGRSLGFRYNYRF
jgi:outer membrane receptor protein involved in Fe transport